MTINYSVSPPMKHVGTIFLKNLLRVGQTFLGKFIEGCSIWGANDQIMPRGIESFTNAFSSNLGTVNLKIFSNHSEIHTWRSCPGQCRIAEGFIIEVNSWEVSNIESHSVSPQVDPDLGYLCIIYKNTLCTQCFRGWGFHAKPAFFFNIFIGDLYFDVLIIGLF